MGESIRVLSPFSMSVQAASAPVVFGRRLKQGRFHKTPDAPAADGQPRDVWQPHVQTPPEKTPGPIRRFFRRLGLVGFSTAMAATSVAAVGGGYAWHKLDVRPRLNQWHAHNQVDELVERRDPGGNVVAIYQKTPGVDESVIMAAVPHNVKVSTGTETDGQYYFGSGVLFQNTDGRFYVLTNHHVVDHPPVAERDGQALYSVSVSGGRSVLGELVKTSEQPDLALLRLPKDFESPHAFDLSQLRNLRRDPLRTGEPVFLVGNPSGLRDTVTTGIVSSSAARRITDLKNLDSYRDVVRALLDDEAAAGVTYVQTDAWCAGGSSGGVLYDAEGRLVGILTWSLNEGTNLCFAIRVDEVTPFLRDAGIDLPRGLPRNQR